MGEGIPQMASFHRKRLRWRMQTFAGAVANVCGNGCNALRLRWAKLAPKSPVLVWIREFLQPSLHVLATFPARTCDLPCTYLREKSCWRGISELDFCGPSIISSHSTNLLGGHLLSVQGEDGHAALFAQRHYQCDNAACRYAVGETLVLVRHDDAFAYLVQI